MDRSLSIGYLWLATGGTIGSGNTNHIRHWMEGLSHEGFNLFLISCYRDSERLCNYFSRIQDLEIIFEDDLDPRHTIKSVRSLRRIVEHYGIQIIHSVGPRADIIASLATKKTGLALVSSVEGNVFGINPSFLKRLLYRFLYRNLASMNASAITAITNNTKHQLVSEFGVPSEQVKVIHSGIDLSRFICSRKRWPQFPAGNDFPVIGYIGRLSLEKGLDLFLEVCSLIGNVFPAARFVIAGDGSQREPLQRLATSLGIEDRVRFLGWLDNPSEFYETIDVFFMTSHKHVEGLPWTVLEAASAGVPIVTSDSGGIKDFVVNGLSGFCKKILLPGWMAFKPRSTLDNFP